VSLWSRLLAERRAVLLPVLIGLVANVAVLALGVWPLRQAVASAEAGALRAMEGLAEARRADMRAKAARTGKERADVELARFYSDVLPRDYQQAINMANFWLGRTAEESRLVFGSGNWDREAIRESPLMKVTGQVSLTGEYADIRRFLYAVETAEEFVIVEKVELSQAATSQGASRLEVTLAVATYYRSANAAGAAAR
jgi:Tfp pilus assembly protein PilO